MYRVSVKYDWNLFMQLINSIFFMEYNFLFTLKSYINNWHSLNKASEEWHTNIHVFFIEILSVDSDMLGRR